MRRRHFIVKYKQNSPEQAAKKMIEAGTLLQDRYRVEKQIGAGGMGAVYIATDERFGSTLAIKETFFTDEKLRKAFEREARLLNSLRHSALPRVSDHFEDGGGQFLVMEYIDGEDLSEQLESESKVFAVSDVLVWADQLLDALEYLHTQEMPVIHRDIKPQNLKLNSRGQIILLDFGLAKGNPTNSESGTAAKSVFGYSRNYASIEQIQGSGTDPRSDLYSLAATLYHLLTGIPPADALTRAMNVLSNKPDPLIEANAIRAEIPYGVSRVLQTAMSLNAEERPVTANEMRAQLADAEHQTAPLSNIQTFNESPLKTDIYSQKTQIQTDASQISSFKQAEIKTEPFPNDVSKVTEIRNPRTGDLEKNEAKIYPLSDAPNETKKPRRGLAIGAALGSLVIAASAASAVYVYKPEVFGLSNNQSNSNGEKQFIISNPPLENSNANSNPIAESNANTTPAPVNNQKQTVVKTETKQAETKQTETKTKTDSTTPNRKKETAAIDEPPDIEADEDENTDSPPTNPKTKQKFPIFVWKKMTQQDRQKLREALEMQRQQQELERKNRQQQIRVIPRPPATPNQ